jgi:SAM-dependent methyltransferase
MDRAPDDLTAFYIDRYVEAERLSCVPHGRLEYERTKELLSRRLPPPPAVVVDVGGATGVHAAWLAQRGYRVELVDLLPAHVEQAATVPGVRAQVADARKLPFDNESADVVLLLGPLYHLLERSDRMRALGEARRVAREDALIAAAAISRHSPLMVYGTEGRLDATTEPLVRQALESGQHDKRLGFTDVHLHSPSELAGELVEAGFRDIGVYGVEGPTWPTLDAHGIEHIERYLPAALACARLAEQDPALISASAHLLALASR